MNTRIEKLEKAKGLIKEVRKELETFCKDYEETEDVEQLKIDLHWFKKTEYEIEHLKQIILE